MREMKDSHIQYLGKIPSHWSVSKYKYHATSRMGETLLAKETSEGYDTEHMIPVYSATQDDSVFGYVGQARVLLHKNDIVIPARGNSIGCATLVKNDIATCTQTTICSTRIRDINPSFLYYCNWALKDEWYRYDGSAIPQITVMQVDNNNLPYPSLQEQQKIADYLDRKCGEIDSVMADLQEQIDKLEQYKRSVISETVTKGLNPKATMKDSGISYVGKIPANWEVRPLYYYFKEGKKRNSKCAENNLLSLSYGKIIRKDINMNGGLLPASFSTYNIIEADDIIIRPTDLQNDKRSLRTGLVTEHGIITSAYIDLVPKANICSRFFHYLLHSYDVKKVFYNMGNGVRQGLNFSEFSKLLILAPDLQEQQEIADYLDKKCAEIESIIEDKKRQLEVVENYKKSLIYEYVTGKKEVSDE